MYNIRRSGNGLGYGNQFLSLLSGGRQNGYLGNLGGHSPIGYGYACEDCALSPYGEHICACEYEKLEQLHYFGSLQSAGMRYGCDCPECPHQSYGHGLHGGGTNYLNYVGRGANRGLHGGFPNNNFGGAPFPMRFGGQRGNRLRMVRRLGGYGLGSH